MKKTPLRMPALIRQGTCNYTGCGACCKVVLLAVHHAYLEPDKRHWLELHGITLAERDGLVWATVPSQCRELAADSSCGIYGKPERPQVCADFPFAQADISIVDEWAGEPVCSYSFREEQVADL